MSEPACEGTLTLAGLNMWTTLSRGARTVGATAVDDRATLVSDPRLFRFAVVVALAITNAVHLVTMSAAGKRGEEKQHQAEELKLSHGTSLKGNADENRPGVLPFSFPDVIDLARPLP